jgi:hypothetical protein
MEMIKQKRERREIEERKERHAKRELNNTQMFESHTQLLQSTTWYLYKKTLLIQKAS